MCYLPQIVVHIFSTKDSRKKEEKKKSKKESEKQNRVSLLSFFSSWRLRLYSYFMIIIKYATICGFNIGEKKKIKKGKSGRPFENLPSSREKKKVANLLVNFGYNSQSPKQNK